MFLWVVAVQEEALIVYRIVQEVLQAVAFFALVVVVAEEGVRLRRHLHLYLLVRQSQLSLLAVQEVILVYLAVVLEILLLRVKRA